MAFIYDIRYRQRQTIGAIAVVGIKVQMAAEFFDQHVGQDVGYAVNLRYPAADVGENFELEIVSLGGG